MTLILTAPIHCRASIAETLMQRHISPNLMKKQTLGLPEGEYIFSKFSFLGELLLYGVTFLDDISVVSGCFLILLILR